MRGLHFYVLIAMSLSSAALAQPAASDASQPQQIAPAPPGADAKPAKQYDTQRQCVDDDKQFRDELKSEIRPVGETIVIDSNFLPTKQHVDVGVRTKYVEGTRYFAGIDREDGKKFLLHRQDILTRRATESDTLVKKRLLDADETIVTLTIPDEYAGLWRKADLYLYTCGTKGSPAKVSRADVRLSPNRASLWICAAGVFAAYLLATFVLRKRDHTFASFRRSLNPVTVSVGPDGKASLSTFQVWLFTLAVAGLFLLFWLQTGMLADLSGTILTLLGISGIGAIAAKGTDQQRNTISAENRAWLLRKNWIPAAKTPVDASNASWRDFFTTNGQFDVYRYQSFVFSFVVIAALIAAGVTQLSTFTIPDTVLGIVGLSQVVYIGGKLVTTTNISDLNTAIGDLRDQERKFSDDATMKKSEPVASMPEAVQLVGQPAYNAYKDKAKDVAALFTAETGIPVGPASLEPSLD
jgi:hypothetical protein